MVVSSTLESVDLRKAISVESVNLIELRNLARVKILVTCRGWTRSLCNPSRTARSAGMERSRLSGASTHVILSRMISIFRQVAKKYKPNTSQTLYQHFARRLIQTNHILQTYKIENSQRASNTKLKIYELILNQISSLAFAKTFTRRSEFKKTN